MVEEATVPDVVIVTLPPLHMAVAVGVSTGASGGALIYIVVIAGHPPAMYEIAAVPVATPVTTPPDEMVATDVFPLLHVPLPVASLSVAVKPGHITVVPVIAAGAVITVMVIVFDITALVVTQVLLLVIVQRIVLPLENVLFVYVLPTAILAPFRYQW